MIKDGPESFEMGDLVPKAPPQQIHIGTVGWDDRSDYYTQGAADNDGHTLVLVQLVRGRDISKPIGDASVAHGHRLLCHISSGIYRIPPKGTRVWVALPAGMEDIPGAGIIFATIEKSPIGQFNDDRVIMDFGTNTHVIIKGKSVSISDYDGRFISAGTPRSGGTPGLTFQVKDGSGGVMQDGVNSFWVTNSGGLGTVMQMKKNLFEVWDFVGGESLVMGAGEYITVAPTIKVQGAGVFLGSLPTPATPVLAGFVGIAGLPSAGVFTSLV